MLKSNRMNCINSYLYPLNGDIFNTKRSSYMDMILYHKARGLCSIFDFLQKLHKKVVLNFFHTSQLLDPINYEYISASLPLSKSNLKILRLQHPAVEWTIISMHMHFLQIGAKLRFIRF